MPLPIQRLAKEILKQPLFISSTPHETTNQDIKQIYYVIREEERDHAIIRLIECEDPKKAIIFCRTKKDVDRLAQVLINGGYKVRGLHGDMAQPQREEVIRNFRSEYVQLLVATDVAARGLNVSEISHVFNYHLPFDSASYLHRIGRTGRAGNKGVACTFVTLREWYSFQRYEKALGTKIQRGEIPTLQNVKTIRGRRLASQIREQILHEGAEQVLNMLPDVDPKIVASKLISFLLSQEVVAGPEFIGVEPRGQQGKSKNEHRPIERLRNKNNTSSKPFKSSKFQKSFKPGVKHAKAKIN